MPDYSLHDTLKIAKAQKGVLWCILGNFVCIFIPFVFIVALPFQIYYIYKLASSLKAGTPVLWVLGMFVPLLSLILLLILSSRATAALRAAGFKVGLMGARTKEIETRIADSAAMNGEYKVEPE